MSNNKLRISAAILGVLVTTAIVAGSSYAFGGGWFKGGSGHFLGKNQTIKTAIENNDYSALGEDPRVSEEQFSQMVEMYGLIQAGDYEAAKELKSNLGFKKAGMMMGGWHGPLGKLRAGMKFNPEKREAIKVALEAGDYNAWLEAVGEDSPLAGKINEDNFSRLVEAHNLMEQAREIFEELGIKKGMGTGWHK